MQEKSNEKRLRFSLPNGLDCLLIENKNFVKSACAFDVASGHMEDPTEHLGLAHFVEHMLFLGSKKFPQPNGFSEILSKFDGSSNAYTSCENTNYHFEADHAGLIPCLEMFSRFFIDPLFAPEMIERERHAIHSEHKKNLEQDQWRIDRLFRDTYREGHPRRKFSTGNLETLAKAGHKEVNWFYNTYYGAQRSKLVLLSKLPLEEQKKWISDLFYDAFSGNIKKDYPSDIFSKGQLPQILSVVPLRQEKKLKLAFQTKSFDPYWETKPGSFLSHLIGHECKGSILYNLKKENLAVSLSSWFESTSFNGLFWIEVSLTEKGLLQYLNVIDFILSYISMLEKEGLPQFIYDESKAIAQQHYDFRDHKEGYSWASYLAKKMQNYTGTDIEYNETLVHKYDENAYKKFLNDLTSSNMTVILVHPDAPVSQKEIYYGTSFTQKKFTHHIKPSHEACMHLPLKNPFVAFSLPIHDAPHTVPVKIQDDEKGVLWFCHDKTFGLPKVFAKISIKTSKPVKHAQNKASSLLYLAIVKELTNDNSYYADLAGLHFDMSFDEEGLVLEFEGFSEKMKDLIDNILSAITNCTIQQEVYADLKQDIIKRCHNYYLSESYNQALYELRHFVLKDHIHTRDIYNPLQEVDLLSNTTLEDVKKFASDLFSGITIEAFFYGNFKTQDYTNLLDVVFLKTNGTHHNREFTKEKNCFLEPGKKELKHSFTNPTNNNALVCYIQSGKRDFLDNALLRMGQSILSPIFFDEMRTQKQLGYIVHHGLMFNRKVLGLNFLIQSESHDIDSLYSLTSQWIKEMPQKLSEIPEEDFSTHRESILSSLLAKEKKMSERFQNLCFEVLDMDGVFDYRKKIADILEKVEKKDVIDFFTKRISQASPLYILSSGRDSKIGNGSKLDKNKLLYI